MSEPRLAELLGSLSLATDQAAGLPAETAIRTSLVAIRLARAADLQGFQLRDAYYAGLLRFLGCSAYAHETARFGAGDDLRFARAVTPADSRNSLDVLGRALRHGLDPRASVARRARSFARLLAQPAAGAELARSHCELAVGLARKLAMSETVIAVLGQSYERWDGGGGPAGLRGDALHPIARVLHVAWRLAAHHALEGSAAALELAVARRGREFDPALCALLQRYGPELVEGLSTPSCWLRFLQAEPAPQLTVAENRLTDIATTFAYFADVKSPLITGHSPAVAALVAAAASQSLPAARVEPLRQAALLHDVGRVAVPNGIWDKPGPLDPFERERMQSHVHETERVLSRSSLLQPSAALAASAHERLDGSGYHRRVALAAIPREARLLAAADVAAALAADRPHRPAHPPAAVRSILLDEVRDGRLCPDAVDAILAAWAGRAARPRTDSDVLREREVEVLRLVARGLSNKQIAAALQISAKTVKRHLENVFERIGVRTRAAAAVYALENGLL